MDTPEPMHLLPPAQRNINLSRRDRSESGCHIPAHGTHEAVTMLQHRVASDLMGRPLGTALDVRGIQERYFLVPENDETVGLVCAPVAAGSVVYAQVIDAWMSPYTGGSRLEDIEMALRVALERARFHDVDVGAACAAMYRHHAPYDRVGSAR